MNKLIRYNLAEIAKIYSSDRNSVVCTAYDVAKLEAQCADLFEACKSLLRFAERDRLPTDVAVNQARAAIAKAKGEQP